MENLTSELNELRMLLAVPFWKTGAFWLSTLIGLAGLGFSIAAFFEARKAKHAATEAGRTVKIQTTTIELTELSQKLDQIQPDIRFAEARDLLAEISRRLRRVISPFADEGQLKTSIESLRAAIQNAQSSLKGVRPTDPSKEMEAPHAIYYAIEGDFSTVNDCVADLLGLFEKQSIDFGNNHG